MPPLRDGALRRTLRHRGGPRRTSWAAGAVGTGAVAQERKRLAIRHLPCFGRPTRLVWVKRRWRCVEPACEAKTGPRVPSTSTPKWCRPAGPEPEACRQLGKLARPVSTVAAELGVCRLTVMNTVVQHGAPLVDDPRRIRAVSCQPSRNPLALPSRNSLLD